MKLYFGVGKTYLQGYVNIIPKETGNLGYYSDLAVSLEEFSPPQGYVDELLFDARLLVLKPKLFWLGWFLGVKSWLWRWTSCVEIQNLPIQSCRLVADLLENVGFEKIGEKRLLHNGTCKLTFSPKSRSWEDIIGGLNELQKSAVLHIYHRVKGTKGIVLKEESVNNDFGVNFKDQGILIIRPLGGLGSQLGLYALGRKISHYSNLTLKIDATFFENTWPGTTERSYRLHHFNIVPDYANSQDLGKVIDADYRSGPWNGEYMYYLRHLIHLHHGYDEHILNIQANTMIIGDGVDFSYFDDIKCLLVKDFAVRTEPSAINRSFISELKQTENTVSVHVRLTDYVPKEQANKEKWLEDKIGFYFRAVRRLENISTKMQYYVFSDDVNVLKIYLESIFQGVASERIHVIFHNGEAEDYEDFRLMSLCRYHITIGSGFSLWAAYLSSNAQKILLHPNASRADIVDFLPAEVVE